METRLMAVILAITCVCGTGSVTAHHSFVVEYDAARPLKLEGVVTKFEWINPHAVLHVDVLETSGARTPWTFEMASPNVLQVNGWTKQTLKVGDRVTLEGYRSFAVATRGMVSAISVTGGPPLVAGEGPLVPEGQ
jgi:hypothetical protein